MNLEQVKAFIAANRWTFARTMTWAPHWYVVREQCEEKQFVAFAEFIRQHDTPRLFGKREGKLNFGWEAIGPILDGSSATLTLPDYGVGKHR